jgi:predicted dehydrogenase
MSGTTGIAIIGCGYVFDHYMTTAKAHPELDIRGVYDIDTNRSSIVSKYYGFSVYPNLQAIIDDPAVGLVLNLTTIEAHFEVTKALLEGGKNVYSEKPLTTDLEDAKTLFALAAERGLVLSSAPCNFLCDSVQTMWKAVRDGAIGRPLLVYAEFDDNPIYLMKPEGWTSRTGAPWPYIHEYEAGCTWEHLGYHLVWMLALFGPARSVTAFSKVTVPHKTDVEMHPDNTPDFSVACIDFESGVTARVTCSIAGPADHRMRVIGDEGELSTDTYRHYQSPVALERFTQLSLNARKSRTLRLQPLLGRIFGIGGTYIPLLRHWKSHATMRDSLNANASFIKRFIAKLKRAEVGAQDKMLGVAETARALRAGEPCPMSPDFILHVTELTLATQRAGTLGGAVQLTTRFDPLQPMASTLASPRNYRADYRQSFLAKRLDSVIEKLHKH